MKLAPAWRFGSENWLPCRHLRHNEAGYTSDHDRLNTIDDTGRHGHCDDVAECAGTFLKKGGSAMLVYVRADANSPLAHVALGESLSRVVEMHLKGFLPYDSTVWINSDLPELGMWVLAEKSTHVRMHRSVYPGWFRLTRVAAKYARTSALSVTSPEATYYIGNVPGFDEVHSTIVLSHPDPDATVGIIANSNHIAGHGGTYTFDPFTVVDLNHYTPPERASTNPVQQAHAMMNGVALLAYGYADNRKQFLNDNIDKYAITFSEDHIAFFRELRNRSEQYAQTQAHEILKKIVAATQGAVEESLGITENVTS